MILSNRVMGAYEPLMLPPVHGPKHLEVGRAEDFQLSDSYGVLSGYKELRGSSGVGHLLSSFDRVNIFLEISC